MPLKLKMGLWFFYVFLSCRHTSFFSVYNATFNISSTAAGKPVKRVSIFMLCPEKTYVIIGKTQVLNFLGGKSMYTDRKIWLAQSDKNLFLLPSMANRHGLIAGGQIINGSGKTA